jgi:hypothetical protein
MKGDMADNDLRITCWVKGEIPDDLDRIYNAGSVFGVLTSMDPDFNEDLEAIVRDAPLSGVYAAVTFTTRHEGKCIRFRKLRSRLTTLRMLVTDKIRDIWVMEPKEGQKEGDEVTVDNYDNMSQWLPKEVFEDVIGMIHWQGARERVQMTCNACEVSDDVGTFVMECKSRNA